MLSSWLRHCVQVTELLREQSYTALQSKRRPTLACAGGMQHLARGTLMTLKPLCRPYFFGLLGTDNVKYLALVEHLFSHVRFQRAHTGYL